MKRVILAQTVSRSLADVLARLDLTSLHLDRLKEAAQACDPARVATALEAYTRDFSDVLNELRTMKVSTRESGLISDVLDRLDSQINRLEEMKASVLTGNTSAVEVPLGQVKSALRILYEKVARNSR